MIGQKGIKIMNTNTNTNPTTLEALKAEYNVFPTVENLYNFATATAFSVVNYLYRRTANTLYLSIRREIATDQQHNDLVQNAVLFVLENGADIDGTKRAVRRAIRDMYKPETQIPDTLSYDPFNPDNAEKITVTFKKELTDEQQILVDMRYMGKGYKQIAKETNKSVSTIKSNIKCIQRKTVVTL